MDSVRSKLLPAQLPHLAHMLHFYRTAKSRVFLDASATGTGKTYTAMALCAVLGLKPIIICPKSVLPVWAAVAELFQVEPLLISNYEQMVEHKSSLYHEGKWDIPVTARTIVIFDEAHRCKNGDTKHAKLLLALKVPKGQRRVLLLSATIADKLESFRNFGYLMDFYGRPSGFNRWLKLIQKSGATGVAALNRYLFPRYAHRMRLTAESPVSAHCFEMHDADKIARQYRIIEACYTNLKEQGLNAGSIMARIQHARQSIEILKVPTFLKLIRHNRAKGRSVVMFVNFNETLDLLARELKVTCILNGAQTLDQRTKAVAAFQNNTEKVILCNIRAGGVGISLHDLHGGHQRVSIISPTWSAQDYVQCLGRIHREGSLTKAVQKIIFCAGTVEANVCKTLGRKLGNLSQLNDGDLESYSITQDARRFTLLGDQS